MTTKPSSTLNTIISDITKIRQQNRFLTVIFSNLNKEKVDGCVDRLTIALEKFNVNTSNFTFYTRLTFLHRSETICAKPEHWRMCRSN